MEDLSSRRILAFAHIQKTAGTTLQLVLRQSFGPRHLNVSQRSGRVYEAGDLAVDLRRLPFLRSIAGHGLMPFVDYGPAGSRLVWFTFVRDPIARFLSHYQHHVEKMGRPIALADFLRETIQANRQVEFLAGGQDLEAAKEVVRKRLACVGRVDRFHESLLLLRERSGMPGLRVAYGQPRNQARSQRLTDHIHWEAARLHDAILEKNELDLALHQWIVDEIYPRQVAEYGEQRLARDRATAFAATRRSLRDRVRQLESAAVRKAVYVPALRASRALRRARAALRGR
jgi:hypothetical protein